jgi:hypothetical protein
MLNVFICLGRTGVAICIIVFLDFAHFVITERNIKFWKMGLFPVVRKETALSRKYDCIFNLRLATLCIDATFKILHSF